MRLAAYDTYDGIVTGTGSMAGMNILQTWSRGGSTNTHGKAFALLPAQPANYFNHHSAGGKVDPIAAQRYSNACDYNKPSMKHRLTVRSP